LNGVGINPFSMIPFVSSITFWLQRVIPHFAVSDITTVQSQVPMLASFDGQSLDVGHAVILTLRRVESHHHGNSI
jgi:hypothetical protein